jgi:hypothetical protein
MNDVTKKLNGKLLLGWMTKEEAQTALCQACCFDPAMTGLKAEQTWQEYQRRVKALPERPLTAATELPLDSSEQTIAEEFLSTARQHGAKNVIEVIKVVPNDLLVNQFHIVTDLSEKYDSALAAPSPSWARTCLGVGMLSGKVDCRQTGNTIVAQLPHAEYRGSFTPDGQPNVIESQKMIGIVRVNGALWLSSGYHRAYAALRALNAPILAAVVTHPVVPDIVLGSRCARLSDYLTETMAMAVEVWRLRYELHLDLQTRTSQMSRFRSA